MGDALESGRFTVRALLPDVLHQERRYERLAGARLEHGQHVAGFGLRE